MQGNITYWHRDRNFGFISDDFGQSYFAHITRFAPLPRYYRVVKDTRVEFDVEQAPRGPMAVNVRIIADASAPIAGTSLSGGARHE
jgi:cold shock CspA family protein